MQGFCAEGFEQRDGFCGQGFGVGEGIDDLRPFNAKAFVDALLD